MDENKNVYTCISVLYCQKYNYLPLGYQKYFLFDIFLRYKNAKCNLVSLTHPKPYNNY